MRAVISLLPVVAFSFFVQQSTLGAACNQLRNVTNFFRNVQLQRAQRLQGTASFAVSYSSHCTYAPIQNAQAAVYHLLNTK